MGRPSLKYGLLAGIILAVVFYIPFAFFQNQKFFFQTSEIIGYTTMILSMLFVFVGIRSYRDAELGGVISFGKAFLTGLLISFIASFIFGLFTIILYKFIYPNFANEMMDFCKRSVMESGQSKEVIDAHLAELESNRELFTNIPFNGFIMFATVFLIGIFISLISSFILKRKEPKTQNA